MHDPLVDVLAPDPRVPHWVYPHVQDLRDEIIRLRRELAEAADIVAAFELGEWHDRGVSTDPGYMTTPEADRLRALLPRDSQSDGQSDGETKLQGDQQGR